jgi:hypothetical protein
MVSIICVFLKTGVYSKHNLAGRSVSEFESLRGLFVVVGDGTCASRELALVGTLQRMCQKCPFALPIKGIVSARIGAWCPIDVSRASSPKSGKEVGQVIAAITLVSWLHSWRADAKSIIGENRLA